MTTLTQAPKEQFLQAIAALNEAQAGFYAGTLKSVQHAHARESALTSALFALASMHDVLLKGPLQLDSNGEIPVTALKAPDVNPMYGCGKFGAEFAARLTRHKARTGAYGPAVFDADSGWCRIHHFAAENLVLEYAKELKAAKAPAFD